MRSATELAAAIRCGELGPVEAVEAHIERIERLDPLVNAVVVRCFHDGRRRAHAPRRKMTPCTWPTAFGLPAVSVPAGRDETGLPLAVQVFGRRGHDLEVLIVASELEEALGGWIDPAQSPSGVLKGQTA